MTAFLVAVERLDGGVGSIQAASSSGATLSARWLSSHAVPSASGMRFSAFAQGILGDHLAYAEQPRIDAFDLDEEPPSDHGNVLTRAAIGLEARAQELPIIASPTCRRGKRALPARHGVDQTEPFVSFDAVIQRRQHAFRPNGAVDPVPVSRLDGRSLPSLCRHCRSFIHALVPLGSHASTFLPAFPRCGFAFRASRGLRRVGTTQALTPAIVTSTTGLPACLAQTSQHSASNHVGDPNIALTAISACPMFFRLRHGIASSPSLPAESSSSSCRLPVCLRLLPTPPRDDAVTFSFGVLACPGTDFHHAVCAPSLAHDPPA